MSAVEDASEEHSEHLPATEDWPRGFGEASWWPFVTAIGAAGIYVTVALFVLGRGEDALVPSIAGPAAAVTSVGIFLSGIYGWLYHAFVADFWERGTDRHTGRALRFATLLFLGSEVTTFGAGFAYYFIIRGSAVWSADVVPQGILGALVILNTVILVSSSVTLHFGHHALLEGNRRRFVRLLGLTLVLGLVFIAGQAYEYYEFVVHEGFTIVQGAYASAFFGLTGLHGLHVSLGAVILAVVYVRARKGQYSPERHTSVSTASMYWHFVDAVWIFLVVVLYAGATVLA